MHDDIQEIGIVKNQFKEPADPYEIRRWESIIVIHEAFVDGLYRIEDNSYLQVIFRFHHANDYQLRQKTFGGCLKGVFASRSPQRPSSLGITTVKLLERNGCKLAVKGLDALDGSPVLDIKPYVPIFDEDEKARIAEEKIKAAPRLEIVQYVRSQDTNTLLLKAGQLHGHYCPDLALGVLAGAYATTHISEVSDGLENLLAIVEVNNCFVDGIQFVTGCTAGNNSLLSRDYGKTAVTLTDRSGNGVRYAVRPDFRERLWNTVPEFQEIFTKVVKNGNRGAEDRRRFKQLGQEAAFRILDIDPETIFFIQPVRINIPEYARMEESIICQQCGENVMANRIVEQDGQQLCRECAGAAYYDVTGDSILYRASTLL